MANNLNKKRQMFWGSIILFGGMILVGVILPLILTLGTPYSPIKVFETLITKVNNLGQQDTYAYTCQITKQQASQGLSNEITDECKQLYAEYLQNVPCEKLGKDNKHLSEICNGHPWKNETMNAILRGEITQNYKGEWVKLK